MLVPEVIIALKSPALVWHLGLGGLCTLIHVWLLRLCNQPYSRELAYGKHISTSEREAMINDDFDSAFWVLEKPSK